MPKHVEHAKFASLFRRFEDEYGEEYARLAARLRNDCPEITRQGRRTGRALRNICFIVWCCFRERERTLIPVLFRAAVLLSAQDDYYDNARIAAEEKESFCSAMNQALKAGGPIAHGPSPVARSKQLEDLISLWSYVARTIPRRSPELQSYWIETACQLNDAMAAENRSFRRATNSYEVYMRTAVHSIGMVFLWATYLVHEQLPAATLREITPVLRQGARVVRLSNDLASYRQHKNKLNAVNLVRGDHPETYIRRLVRQESVAFRQHVEVLDVSPQVRGVLLHSMSFLSGFYQRSDFHRGRVW